MNKPGMRYIDVFNSGRDTDRPLITLYDDESITMFFDLITSSEHARKYFEDGKVALVAFHTAQTFQIGTGSYTIGKDGKIKVGYETGVLMDILERLHLKHLEQGDNDTDTGADAAPGNNGSNGER